MTQSLMALMAPKCRACGHQWEEKLDLPMELGAFTARVRGWRVCPKCRKGGKGGEVKMVFVSKEPIEKELPHA